MALGKPVGSELGAEDDFAVLFAENPVPMCLFDVATLCFLQVNDAAVLLYGYSREEFRAMRFSEIHSDEIYHLLRESSGEQRSFRHAGVWRQRCKDNSMIDVEIHSRRVTFNRHDALLLVMHDVTARRRLERLLLHAQRMEAVGRLAAGVAHDFNNILTALLGYSEFVLADPQLPPSVAADALEIRHAALNAAELTRQILSFGRKQLIERVVVNSSVALGRLERLLQRVIGENIKLSMRLDPDVDDVRLYPGQFEQIVVNLAVNARDAMPTGGTLTIETSMVHFDDAYASTHPGVAAGRYVIMALSDTGAGIDPKLLPHVFEPFFTTKLADKGTGLGLATVYGIVKQNGGNIWVYSEPGQGTMFKVYLAAQPSADPPTPVQSEDSVRGGTETILLVEDDAQLRRLAERLLTGRGYTVLTAATGSEGLLLGAWPGRSIDLLFTDVVLPDLPGPVLAAKLCEVRPEMKVLFASGYPERAIAEHGVAAGAVFIAKPFRPDTLARRIREVLDPA
jgi:two-component system, cell cycle sensor histidine kinase and response regulator CckA